MSPTFKFILSTGIAVIVVAMAAAIRGVRVLIASRGKRLVTCPENHCVAAVELNSKGAALASFRGGDYLCLQDCSRWPERKDCGQECLTEVEALGDDCLVRNLVSGWYRGKNCVFCQKPIDHPNDWAGHVPALLAPDSRTISWENVPADKLPEVLASYRPVCWSCHIAESFRRQHPELITDRPARW